MLVCSWADAPCICVHCRHTVCLHVAESAPHVSGDSAALLWSQGGLVAPKRQKIDCMSFGSHLSLLLVVMLVVLAMKGGLAFRRARCKDGDDEIQQITDYKLAPTGPFRSQT